MVSGTAEFKLLKHPGLGLGLKVGKVYNRQDLVSKCKDDKPLIAKLVKLLKDRSVFCPSKAAGGKAADDEAKSKGKAAAAKPKAAAAKPKAKGKVKGKAEPKGKKEARAKAAVEVRIAPRIDIRGVRIDGVEYLAEQLRTVWRSPELMRAMIREAASQGLTGANDSKEATGQVAGEKRARAKKSGEVSAGEDAETPVQEDSGARGSGGQEASVAHDEEAPVARREEAPVAWTAAAGEVERYVVNKLPHLGLNLRVGRAYARAELQARCGYDADKLQQLEAKLQDRSVFSPAPR